MERVAVVDYGLCNVDSVVRALAECGADAFLVRETPQLERADRIVLPGVGAFDVAMAHLRETGLAEAMTKLVLQEGVPFLGVCLGMQLVATTGYENGTSDGLGWIDATVERITAHGAERIPHVGWNEVDPTRASPLFDGIPARADFYFVHSYHVRCSDPADVLATTPYGGTITSALARERIFGVQFHPEKSQRHGLQLLRNFLAVPD
jgi:glutamine amidotransferase